MPLLNKHGILLNKSDGNFYLVNTNKDLIIYNFDSEFDNILKKTLIYEHCTLSDVWADLNLNDELFGTYNEKNNGEVIYFYAKNKVLYKNKILKYDIRNTIVTFPKLINDESDISLFFYSTNLKKMTCKLTHYYKKSIDDKWEKNIVDQINTYILNDYLVFEEKEFIDIIYLNMINGFEEVFINRFTFKNQKWNESVQLTDSKRAKQYLSALKDEHGNFHIVYKEVYECKECCNYLKINERQGTLKHISIKEGVKGHLYKIMFPSIILYKDMYYIQWLENYELWSCFTKNNGISWSKPIKNKDSLNKNFIRCSYKCNSINEFGDNVQSVFCEDDTFHILGL